MSSHLLLLPLINSNLRCHLFSVPASVKIITEKMNTVQTVTAPASLKDQPVEGKVPGLRKELPSRMTAMVMVNPGTPLECRSLPVPVPLAGQILIQVIACGVCRTDLHIMDGELPHPILPLIPGHEVVGIVRDTGSNVKRLKAGDVVGMAWLAYTCGHCRYCMRGQENLCENALFNGYTTPGGYAEYAVAYEDFCFLMPDGYGTPSGAPLLCAGLIGFRAYRMMHSRATKLGIYGFGAAAHILIQIAMHENKAVYAFTRVGDTEGQAFSRSLGAVWAGNSLMFSPVALDAALIFAPVGPLIVSALNNLDKGGQVICGGIHMSDVPGFPYRLLWEERSLQSVANLTRADGKDFLELAAKVPVRTAITEFPLEKANEALKTLREGSVNGAIVLVM